MTMLAPDLELVVIDEPPLLCESHNDEHMCTIFPVWFLSGQRCHTAPIRVCEGHHELYLQYITRRGKSTVYCEDCDLRGLIRIPVRDCWIYEPIPKGTS